MPNGKIIRGPQPRYPNKKEEEILGALRSAVRAWRKSQMAQTHTGADGFAGKQTINGRVIPNQGGS